MLPIQEIEKIEERAFYQRKAHELGDESPIGLKIFSIIENAYNSFVLLYPLKTKNVAGFTRKQGESIQIFVNTNFNANYQVFAAAHELYHLIDLKQNDSNKTIICNRNNISESMDYEIPYKTILKRSVELKIIGNAEYGKLVCYDKRMTEYYSMLDMEMSKHVIELEKPNKRKYHSLNVPKMAYDAYRNNIITVSKIKSIIEKYGKTLKDFKICEPEIKPIDIDLSKYNIFAQYLGELTEDMIIKTRTGFKDTAIWNKLYEFQKDGVMGAIDKIEKYNGCIIADSVGLGKTFTALAIIKYYELRNDRVLVLVPKKLRDNWTIYTQNDRRNIFAQDRFNYDVLNHTDLSRTSGYSGEINLSTVN